MQRMPCSGVTCSADRAAPKRDYPAFFDIDSGGSPGRLEAWVLPTLTYRPTLPEPRMPVARVSVVPVQASRGIRERSPSEVGLLVDPSPAASLRSRSGARACWASRMKAY